MREHICIYMDIEHVYIVDIDLDTRDMVTSPLSI